MSPAQQQQFEVFWRNYPRKVGKLAAAREWARKRPDLDTVLAALAQQRETWTDPRFTPHPRTWISQGRWLDELSTRKLFTVDDWFDECQRLHGGRCNGRATHAIQRQLDVLKTGPV